MASYYVRSSGGSDSNDGSSHANAWATIQHALDNMTTGQENQLNINGSFTLSAELSATTYGSASIANPLIFRGYTSTENDGGVATINGGTNQILDNNTIDYYHFVDLEFRSTNIAPIFVLDNSCSFYRCHFFGNGSMQEAIQADNDLAVVHCLFSRMSPLSGDAIVFAVNGGTFLYNFMDIEDGSGTNYGLYGNTWTTAHGNVIVFNDTNTLYAIYCASNRAIVTNNSIFSQSASTGAGIRVLGGSNVVANNIVAGFSGTGGVAYYFPPSNWSGVWAGNRYWNCTSASLSSANNVLVVDNSSLASNPFTLTGQTNYYQDDFELDSAFSDTGWPDQVFDPDGNFSTRNEAYRELGALPRQVGGGSGGGGFVAPGIGRAGVSES